MKRIAPPGCWFAIIILFALSVFGVLFILNTLSSVTAQIFRPNVALAQADEVQILPTPVGCYFQVVDSLEVRLEPSANASLGTLPARNYQLIGTDTTDMWVATWGKHNGQPRLAWILISNLDLACIADLKNKYPVG